jgi:hypothetical protein
MDLKKAKIILIILFLLINLYLLFVNVFSGSINRVSKNVISNVYDLFEKKGIEITCAIPDNLKPLSQMELSGEVKTGELASVKFSSDELGFDVNDYIQIYDFGKYRLYAEKYKGFIVMENRVRVSDDGMYYTKRDIVGFNKGVKSIIPVYIILLKNYLNSDIKRIDKIEIVYLKYTNEDIVGPVWLIVADGNARYFYAFDAFNGIEMTLKQ